ncbi:ubiquitin carboxyl-terminal hydrolase 15, partial [Plakobranchus ocellatus]
MLPQQNLTSFHRQVTSERRFGMSSPSSSCGGSLPIAAVAGIRAATPAQTINAATTVSSGHPLHHSPPSGLAFSPDHQQAQKSVLEHLLDRELVEGDFWYVIVAEWLEQLKKFVGINSGRKYYKSQRACSPPGPIVTRRDYAHTVDVVHEDAWRALLQWYGLAEGHKAMKLVVYKYARGPEIEHNINSFK